MAIFVVESFGFAVGTLQPFGVLNAGRLTTGTLEVEASIRNAPVELTAPTDAYTFGLPATTVNSIFRTTADPALRVLGDGLTVENGVLAGGTVTGLSFQTANGFVAIRDVRIDAADLIRAATTPWPLDDFNLERSVMRGDDVIRVIGTGRDSIDGREGDDVIFAGLNSDTVIGFTGNDAIFGGDGFDILSGGDGGDVLSGGRGNDTLRASAGFDMLDGGRGDDVMSGGFGPDRFVFGANTGDDLVTDFQDGVDKVIFVSGPASFAALTITAIDSNTAEVSWATGSVTLQTQRAQDLTAADFVFSGRGAAIVTGALNDVLADNRYFDI